ncbi:unnamed protein product [Orchesella dallaii]|uniref:Ig-like domain-containing protein n=1 Tax=Orchesella dallaii TaxID=48710 RepID=A0ABP1PKQ6_9HEXA
MIFVSYLSWTFVRSSVIDRNASCVFETDWTRNPDLFSRTLGSAVTVELKDEVYPGETWIGIVVITLYDSKLISYFNHWFSTERINDSCKSNLIMDLSRNISAAVCKPNHYLPILQTCANLDSNSQKCNGVFENLDNVSGKRSMYLPNSTLPVIIYCKHITNYEWTSFTRLYPTFELNNWKSIIYDLGGSVEAAAEKGHSIQITLSNYWPFNEFWMFNSSVLPLTFAINETVELACLAVESLYMRGFEWRLGTKIILSDESSQTYHFNAKDSLHVTRRSITFREEYNDSELEPKTISCGGLLWNSKRWHMSNPLNYVLLDPVAPSGSVTHMLNKDGYDEFTCNYQGWPKPKVTWFISEQVVLITNIY